MRLATVFDTDVQEARPVFELPGGQRVELRELLQTDDADRSLNAHPIFFDEMTQTVAHLDDVIEAARDWATHRSENTRPLQTEASRTMAYPFCSPIPQPRSVREFNTFEEHARRQSLNRKLALAWHDAPSFNFINAGSLIGHERVLTAPRGTNELDFGLQIAAVIGRGGRDIKADEAWKHIAGFTIVNAFFSVDRVRQEQALGSGPGKSRDFATAVGPYLVTLDALRDRLDSSGRMHLAMSARLNGQEVGRGDASAMSFAWPHMIALASADADLFPGDLLLSGTITGGCLTDHASGRLLENGDVVELEIERLGVLRNQIEGITQMPKRDRADIESSAR